MATIALTSLTGITALVTTPPASLVIALGAASLLATFLTSLQTFFKYEERAALHLSFGAKYAAVRRQLEVIGASGIEPVTKDIEEIRKEIDRLAEQGPNIPKETHKKVIG